MKIRLGFVSNSSSSSFVIFGKTRSFSSIKSKEIDNITILSTEYDGEGTACVDLNKEKFKYLTEHPELQPGLIFIEEFHRVGEFTHGAKLDMSKLPKDVEVFVDTFDQCSFESLEEFKLCVLKVDEDDEN